MHIEDAVKRKPDCFALSHAAWVVCFVVSTVHPEVVDTLQQVCGRVTLSIVPPAPGLAHRYTHRPRSLDAKSLVTTSIQCISRTPWSESLTASHSVTRHGLCALSSVQSTQKWLTIRSVSNVGILAQQGALRTCTWLWNKTNE